MTIATANPKTQEWATFYAALKTQLTDQLGSVYGPVMPFSSAQSVNFYWGETNPQGGGELYNSATYDFLNTRMAINSAGALLPAGGALSLDIGRVPRHHVRLLHGR